MKTPKHPKLANGQPAISCFALSQQELLRREDAAIRRAEVLARQENDTPAHEIGRTQLWHTECPLGLKLAVCDEELFRLAAFLPSTLLTMNGGQPLDFWDYAYVADVLRECLCSAELPLGDRQNLRRALAWAEEQGSGLRDYGQE